MCVYVYIQTYPSLLSAWHPDTAAGAAALGAPPLGAPPLGAATITAALGRGVGGIPIE